MKPILVIIGILLVASVGFFGGRKLFGTPQNSVAATSTVASENLIIADDQIPGNELTLKSVQVSDPAVLLVQTDKKGTPGEKIGSVMLPRGSYQNVLVKLDADLATNTPLYVSLYTDDGKGAYDPTLSVPLVNAAGNVVSLKLKVKNK